jgi:cupin 2 domain-containing protein
VVGSAVLTASARGDEEVADMHDEGGDPACWAHVVGDDGIVRRGSLHAGAPPEHGERFDALAQIGGVTIELIVSGPDVEPTRYLQDHDEWVVVLDGAARLTLDGTPVELHAGEWVLLPAHVAHEVVHVEAGTRWLALHGPPK